MSIHSLRALLDSVTPGKVSADLELEVVGLLSAGWSTLSGADKASMTERKIGSHRVEQLTWQPPVLSFVIERHGGTVKGSKLGELQGWVIDLERHEATFSIVGSRRLVAFAPKLDVQALALELFGLIQQREIDGRLTWKGATCVKVNMSVAIPDGPPIQTTQGRRKKLRTALTALLMASGWRHAAKGTHLVFERPVEA